MRVRVFEEPPKEIALILGDLAQCLRACLEQMAWQLVLISGRKPGRATSFPIFLDPKKYGDSAPRVLNGMSERAKAFIEGTQPYNVRPNDPWTDPLWMIHESARVDRHRLLHTITTVLVGAGLRPGTVQDIDPHQLRARFTPREGTRLKNNAGFGAKVSGTRRSLSSLSRIQSRAEADETSTEKG